MKLTFKLILSLLLVATYNLLPDAKYALGIEVLLILLVGIPHGATDHLLFNVFKYNKVNSKLSFSFLLPYLGVMVVYAIFWILFPQLSLIIFLIISAYHFGETQWFKRFTFSSNNLRNTFYFLWGVSLISSIFFIFPNQSFFYLKNLVTVDFFTSFQDKLPFISGLSTANWVAFLFYTKERFSWVSIMEFGFLLLTVYFTDLLFGFVVFFTIWHSVDAIKNQIETLRKFKPSFSLIHFIVEALPFTFISLFGISFFLLIFFKLDLKISYVTLFFIAISVLTLPHMWIIERFYRN